MADLVTGEAVVLELRLAKLPSRALAFAIDVIVQFGLLIGLSFLLRLASPALDEALATAFLLVAIVLTLIGYPLVMETATRGRSLGKLVFGLRVVRDDGGPIHFRHALMRALAGAFADFWLTGGAGAILSSLLSRRGKRLGDLWAGTVVIHERVPVQGGPVAQMPPQLAAWAAGLELSQLPDDLALAARQYLARRPLLAPDVSESMAQRLAEDVARYIGRGVPVGVPAWVYLAAVVAERRNREMAKLMSRRQVPPAEPAGQPAAAAHAPAAQPAWRPSEDPFGPLPTDYAEPPATEPARAEPRTDSTRNTTGFVPPA